MACLEPFGTISGTTKGKCEMDDITNRAIGAGKIPGRIRARITRGGSCPGCRSIGSMRKATHAEDWAVLGQATVSHLTCTVCGVGILERTKSDPQIAGLAAHLSRARRLLSR